jgi:UDP-N-acetylglucosamine 1-carboxyvinyltransferase
MDKFLIKGGKPLHGTVRVSGAKNSALPVMAAALLTSDQVSVHNIPKVRDLITMSKLLAFMGASVSITEIPASDYIICAPTLNHAEAPYELVKTMRASILTSTCISPRLKKWAPPSPCRTATSKPKFPIAAA